MRRMQPLRRRLQFLLFFVAPNGDPKRQLLDFLRWMTETIDGQNAAERAKAPVNPADSLRDPQERFEKNSELSGLPLGRLRLAKRPVAILNNGLSCVRIQRRFGYWRWT